MYNRQGRKEEAYLYKALKLSGSLQIGEEEKSEQIRKIMEISKVDWLTGKKRERTDFTAFLIRQIPFIGWKMWSIQALVMISAVVFFYGTDAGTVDVTWLLAGRRLAFLVGALGTVMAMIGIPYVMQSFRYRMYEMEKATKHGLAGMLLSRMIVLSAGDLVTVLLCMFVISSKNYASAGMVLLWYLAPLFLTGSFCAGWMQKIEAKLDMEDQTDGYIQICEGACVGLLILQYLIYIKLPSVYGNAGWWIGILVIAAGAMLYVVVEELIPEMSTGEHSNVGTIFFAVGFSLMMVLDVALG